MKRVYLIISLLTISIISLAQPNSPNISHKEIYIGDHFTYSFKIPIDNFSEHSNYIPKEKKDSLEIIGLNIDTILDKGKEYIDFTYKLTSFIVGEHQITDNNGSELSFEVIPFPIDTTKIEIKDIKANLDEPFTIREIMPIIIWVLIVAVIMVVIYYGIKLWKKYRKINIKEIFMKPKPKLPAHIIAINSLNELRIKRLYENARVKEYFSEISEILRTYLYNRFSISAIEMTTDEILREINKRPIIEEDSLYLIEYILREADLVKFAKHLPESYISDKCMKDSLNFVEKTKPVEINQESEGKEEENV